LANRPYCYHGEYSMSQRGLLLALQRLHDDPGFIDRVAQDPNAALGVYDLGEAERRAIAVAASARDNRALQSLAQQAGLDWTSTHISGLGAPAVEEQHKRGEIDHDFWQNQPYDDLPLMGHWGKGVDWGHPGYGSRRDHKNVPPGS
jgi:hypothetical protein